MLGLPEPVASISLSLTGLISYFEFYGCEVFKARRS